ncbi:MAG: beta-lactamase family protein, partial [Anaerolineales bacterium]|nr:beta-lactamase family protein [Anaerolineales bacterium]
MKTSAARVLLITTAVLLLLITAHSAVWSEESASGATAAVPQPAGLTDRAELEAFIDGMMAAHFPPRHIPAATIAVVKDGALFFAKGYGFADREKRIPVDPATTLIRPGSISKLFTWTAVMQLVEQGKLDLDADVNSYLKTFKIPATFPEPITMRHLLTHTPGFEEQGLGLFARDPADLKPLRESLAAKIPARVRPAGSLSSYSNYGTALAGLIVEEVSGVPFAEFVEQNILRPLGMEHSTFREPLPAELAPDMAVGYQWKKGRFEPGKFELIGNYGPAGSLSATATDMAKFMIAHLQLGRLGETRILKEETARRMHSRLYGLDPRLPGMAHGFYEMEAHGVRGIGHGGDTMLFHSELLLLPEHNVGLFVSYGSSGLPGYDLLPAFIGRYFAAPDPAPPEPPAGFEERTKRVAGVYRFTRHNYTSIEKAFALPSVVSVAAGPKGTITTSIQGFGEPWVWREVAPNYYGQIDGTMRLVFREAADGSITNMYFSLLPFMPCYRVAWYATPTVNYVLLGATLFLCISTLVSFCYHRKGRKQDPTLARWCARTAAAVSVMTICAVGGVVAVIAAASEELAYGLP